MKQILTSTALILFTATSAPALLIDDFRTDRFHFEGGIDVAEGGETTDFFRHETNENPEVRERTMGITARGPAKGQAIAFNGVGLQYRADVRTDFYISWGFERPIDLGALNTLVVDNRRFRWVPMENTTVRISTSNQFVSEEVPIEDFRGIFRYTFPPEAGPSISSVRIDFQNLIAVDDGYLVNMEEVRLVPEPTSAILPLVGLTFGFIAVSQRTRIVHFPLNHPSRDQEVFTRIRVMSRMSQAGNACGSVLGVSTNKGG